MLFMPDINMCKMFAGSQSLDWEPGNEAPASRNGKLELPTPNSQAGAWELARLNTEGVRTNGAYFALVPNLQIGNPEGEALASRGRKLELPKLNSQAGAWELAKLP